MTKKIIIIFSLLFFTLACFCGYKIAIGKPFSFNHAILVVLAFSDLRKRLE